MTDTEGRASGPSFPCASLAEALPHLRRPAAPEAVRFRIQNAAGEAAQVAAYVDARLVSDRLDLVCGGRWRPRFEELPAALVPPPCDRDGQPLSRPPIHVRCRLTCFGVTREDVGEGEDPKAAFSDAIKRAAVHFGVGRVLYAMRAPWLRAGDGEGELRRNRKDASCSTNGPRRGAGSVTGAGSRSAAAGCSASRSSTATRRERLDSRAEPSPRCRRNSRRAARSCPCRPDAAAARPD
jgi:Rad52/22 family double-strand break repair protein